MSENSTAEVDNAANAGKLTENPGEVANVEPRCPAGEHYDPVQKKCVEDIPNKN